jgi:hypothetical protein
LVSSLNPFTIILLITLSIIILDTNIDKEPHEYSFFIH